MELPMIGIVAGITLLVLGAGVVFKIITGKPKPTSKV
mgnify:CR=1 FL=1